MSKLDYAANAFIRAYIDEVSRIKKRGTRRKKTKSNFILKNIKTNN